MPWLLPSFLSPTFLVLGLIAISLPVLFHFFRRTPKGSVQFSTLMFLKPSPPRLTRRSKVDNWLLLLLRGLILLLIALAFGRLFFRQTDFLNITDLPTRRVAILVDTSASMQRSDLWKKAKASVAELINELGPNDEAAIFTFDRETQTLVGFGRDATSAADNAGSSAANPSKTLRRSMMIDSLEGVSPSWNSTDLGRALIETVEQLESDSDRDSADSIAESQIVLVTDLQSGADIKALQSFEWPKTIPVELRLVETETANNATLSLMEKRDNSAEDAKLRVKVFNVEKSEKSQFDISWLDKNLDSKDPAATVVVPPGQSRIVSIAMPNDDLVGIELTGDDELFDNRYFLSNQKQTPEKIMFVGEDEVVREQLRFYLKKACSVLIGKRVEFIDTTEFTEDTQCDIVFITGTVGGTQSGLLKKFANDGGLVCAVVTKAEMGTAIGELLDRTVKITEAEKRDYSLLAEIDFKNRLFAPFADPKFSNFANIRFWRHRKVEIDEIDAIAKFDNDNLAIGSTNVGKGTVYVFSSGWNPADSQFALSSKFVGVMMSMMLKQLTRENLNFELGDAINVSKLVDGEDVKLTRPDGENIQLEPATEKQVLKEIDQPGIYQLSSGTQSKPLAFNLAANESQTDVMDSEMLEQSGIQLGTMSSAAEKVELERQRRDSELESQQKLWRWMLVLAILVLFVETILSSYYADRQTVADAQQES